MKAENVVIVTGAGRGIGAATAKLFAKNGYAVCINYKSNSVAANEVADSIISHGGKCIVAQADVSTEQGVSQLYALVDEKLGAVSVLVNNAGILKPQSRL